MYSESRQFLKKKRKSGRRIYVEREQKLKSLCFYDWNNPKFGFSQRERPYFSKREEYCPVRKMHKVYYDFIEPWRFVLRVRPNMITHYKPLDEELEKEYAELESYLSQYKVAGIIHKTIYGKSSSWNTGYETDLIKSRKYFNYKMSATDFADNYMDE